MIPLPADSEWSPIIKDKYYINHNGQIWNGKKYMKPWIHNGYYELTLQIDAKKKHFPIHILLARSFIANPLNKPCVDHINGNKLDNRLENLRWATYNENQFNRQVTASECGYKGVCLTNTGKYISKVCYKGKHFYLGSYDDPKIAHHEYCKKAKELHGEFHNPGTKPSVSNDSV